jgi:hypothetical protein
LTQIEKRGYPAPMKAAAGGSGLISPTLCGYSVTIAGKAARKVGQAGSAAKRAWAACLRKIFEWIR